MRQIKCINLTVEMMDKLTALQVEYIARHKKAISFSEITRIVLERGLRDKRIIK